MKWNFRSYTLGIILLIILLLYGCNSKQIKEAQNDSFVDIQWEYNYLNTTQKLNNGENITIAILDTKINRALASTNVTEKQFLSETSCMKGNEITHADEIVSIINNISPKSEIVVCVIANDYGEIIEDDFIAALKWIELQEFDIVNLSLFLNNYSNEIADSLFNLNFNETTIVAATGNQGNNRILFPANLDFVFSAGAIDLYGERWINSNYGDGINFSLPGKNIGSNYSEQKMNGTSFSSAFLTGVISQLKSEYTQISNLELKEQLIEMSGNEEYNIYLGYGTPVFNK